ncbi:hypothetical protein K466DRAFT_187242 [Polyporus arcularius HHB13444]|uniref:Uncharacterized protein n=1 Tax=Polyporus arcularius HHB13444 TaxID=1314778 RepID=A0A5C3PT86_9APHY|nr:hypothetical protein K466DRAFT_187242 [Polyporus arcularius HHB13444]
MPTPGRPMEQWQMGMSESMRPSKPRWTPAQTIYQASSYARWRRTLQEFSDLRFDTPLNVPYISTPLQADHLRVMTTLQGSCHCAHTVHAMSRNQAVNWSRLLHDDGHGTVQVQDRALQVLSEPTRTSDETTVYTSQGGVTDIRGGARDIIQAQMRPKGSTVKASQGRECSATAGRYARRQQ